MKNLTEVIAAVNEAINAKLKAAKFGDLSALQAEVQDMVKLELTNATKALEDVVAKAVLQQIPKAALLNPAQGIDYDPTKGLKTLGKDRIENLAKQMKFILTPGALVQPEANRKALEVAVGADGGFLVPQEFIAEVQRKLVKISLFRSHARNFNGAGATGSIPRETGTVTKSYVKAERKSQSNTQFTLGQLIWSLNKRRGNTKFSKELFDFSAIDILALLSSMFADADQVLDDQIFMTGTGSGEPKGLSVATSGMGSMTMAGANLDWTDLVDLKHLLPVQYRSNAIWQMSDDNLQIIGKLKDDNNRPLLSEISGSGLAGASIPDQTVGILLGKPVIQNNSDPYIHFGDLERAYAVFDKGTQEMSSTSEGGNNFDEDTQQVKVISYDDGQVNIAEAMAYISNPA